MKQKDSQPGIVQEHETGVSKQNIPVAKYLLVTQLFVLSFFVGAWFGYSFGSEMNVEEQKFVAVSESDNEHKNDDVIATVSETPTSNDQIWDQDVYYTVSRIKNDNRFRSYQFSRYVFENEQYQLSFVPVFANDVSEFVSMQGDSLTLLLERNKAGGGIENFFQIQVVDNNYCNFGWCLLDTVTELVVASSTWEYVGDQTYCDVGHCARSENIYKRAVGDFMVYVITLEPIAGTEFTLDGNGERVYTTQSQLLIDTIDELSNEGILQYILSTMEITIK